MRADSRKPVDHVEVMRPELGDKKVIKTKEVGNVSLVLNRGTGEGRFLCP